MAAGARILVAGTSREALQELTGILEHLGWPGARTVLGAEKLQEQLTAIQAGLGSQPLPGLVLADSRTTRLAVEAARLLRSRKDWTGLPLLALTAAEDAETPLALLGDPHAAFLAEPLEPAALAAAVQKLTGWPRPDPGRESLLHGLAHLAQGDLTQAAQALSQALKQGAAHHGPTPGSGEVFLALSSLFALQGRPERAREMAGRARAALLAAAQQPHGEQDMAPQPPHPPHAPQSPGAGGPGAGLKTAWDSHSEAKRRELAQEYFVANDPSEDAFRMNVPDWGVHVAGQDVLLQAVDLSMAGASFEAFDPPPAEGASLTLALYRDDEPQLTHIPATVTSLQWPTLTCAFGRLTRSQESLLNKLLMDLQKELRQSGQPQATSRDAGQDRDDKGPASGSVYKFDI